MTNNNFIYEEDLRNTNSSIFDCVCSMLGIKDKGKKSGVLRFTSLSFEGRELVPDEFVDYLLPRPFETNDGNVVGVLVYGDGNTKYLLDNADEPKSWRELSKRALIKLAVHITALSKSMFN